MGIGGWLQDNVPGVEEVTDAVSDGAEWVEDGINDGADWVEQTVSDGAAGLGGWLDDRSHDVADALDHVGWESGADWVEDRGDDVADALGAEVPEKELGQTEDKTELVHGEVEKLDELSTRLTTFSGHMADASSGLGAIDPGVWEGSSSAGFEAKMSKQPGAWDAAADACSSAATAISDYAGTVTWAQGRAQAAIDQYRRGVAASERATTEYNRQVDHYNANRDKPEGERPERPGEFVDPGLADREAAQTTLDAARRRRDEAGSAAQTAVSGATADAPEEPEFTEEVAGTLSDLDGMADVWGAHLTMGALKGVTGLAAFVRTLNPNDQWNMRNPAAYQENLSNLAAGLVTAVTNPQQTLESLLEGFTTDPAEAIGMLIPELIGAKGLGRLGSLGRLDGPDGPDTPNGPDGLPRTPETEGNALPEGNHADLDSLPGYHTDLSDGDYEIGRGDPRAGDLVPDGYDPYGGLTRQEYYDRYWDPEEGNWNYPDDDGFGHGPDGGRVEAPNTLQPGEVIDRFGGPGGGFAAPSDTPYEQRSLPPTSLTNEYHQYRVVRPLPDSVTEGPIAPAFGQPGGGVQYYFPDEDRPIEWYLRNGYLEEVHP